MSLKIDSLIGLGMIGCGSFGVFCLNAFAKVKELKIIAVADVNERLAKKAAHKFKCKWYSKTQELINDPEVEIVHIVTPPSTHFSLSRYALQKEKHVLCEKPLALSLSEADEILNLARENGVILPVNLVLRYVPITNIIKEIIQSEILGDPLRAYFENYATDSNLDKAHWFWDKKQSGGIFVEHGVHFFDLYHYWFGNGKVIWAYSAKRSNTNQEDRVLCVLRHQSGVISHHYHGFDQPSILDRQKHHILFERGDIVINGWIPESFIINAILNDNDIFQLKNICKNAKFKVLEKFTINENKFECHGKSFTADQHLQVQYTSNVDKLTIYSSAIAGLVIDQINFIRNREHKRVIREENGREALRMALETSNYIS